MRDCGNVPARNTPQRGETNVTPCARRALGGRARHQPRLKSATAQGARRLAARRSRRDSCAFQARVFFVTCPKRRCRMGLFLFRISCGASSKRASTRRRTLAISRFTQRRCGNVPARNTPRRGETNVTPCARRALGERARTSPAPERRNRPRRTTSFGIPFPRGSCAFQARVFFTPCPKRRCRMGLFLFRISRGASSKRTSHEASRTCCSAFHAE